MRNLSRMIFINSANIPYSEIKLDGNVHFIGTQGVGKSTVLRAILFFYNSSPAHLGISREKKNFDSFYFPFSNSYIVYEVERENGRYCVIAMRALNRICFRFIDAEYDRNWFIDNGNKILDDWSEIRRRIVEHTNVQPSKLITTYDFFRDIIYGNNKRPEMVEFRKYAIIESPKYMNIPRTIQNVFLNTKLDADFIKDTIINSMSDETVSIDLDYFRNQIREFENEYNDVFLWIRKEANGSNKKTLQAEDVIKKYNEIRYSKKRIKELREELNFALGKCRSDIPEINNDIRNLTESLERQNRLISEETSKHTKERDSLNKSLSIIEDKIKTSRSRKQKYADMNVSEIVSRVSKEENLQSEKEHTELIHSELLSGSKDITLKYKNIADSIKAASAEKANSLRATLAEAREMKAEEKGRLLSGERTAEEKARDISSEEISTAENIISELSDALGKEAVHRERILRTMFYEKEIKGKEAEISALEASIVKDKAERKTLQAENEKIRIEEDAMLKDCDSKHNAEIENIVKKENDIKSDIKEINTSLDNYKGSFCEWLSGNLPGWQNTVGKVVDERNILYNKNLSPSKSVFSDSVFGIKIDITSVEKEIMTPDFLKTRLEEANKDLQEAEKEIEAILNTREAEKNRIRERENKKGKAILDKIQSIGLRIFESNERIKRLKIDTDNLAKAGKEKKNSALREIDDRRETLTKNLERAKNELAMRKSALDKKLATIQKETRHSLSMLEEKFAETQKDIDSKLSELERTLAKELEEMKRTRLSELETTGADMASIKRYENRLQEINSELSYIKAHRQIVYDYDKDKRELFDNEPAFISERKELEAKLGNLEEKFKLRKSRLDEELRRIGTALDERKVLLKDVEENIRKAQTFLSDPMVNPAEERTDIEKPSGKSCIELTDDLTVKIVSQENDMKKFKNAVNVFNDGFSSRNLFNFKTGMISDKEFMDFAASLDYFLANDMLHEYQRRISERYTDIIRRIAKETSDLTQHSSEINKVINEINKDFSKDNFVGAIKNIALRQLGSDNRLVQLLMAIKDFNDENQYNMGEVDLFTQDNRSDVNAKAVDFLLRFMKALQNEPDAKNLGLADSFKLEFRIIENDNDTGWIEKISNVGSDGTDILVKAMINIMLINVFKERASRKFEDFRIHCMMDEIGKLHPNNIKGILTFANKRNILLVNSSPTTFNADDYKYTYLVEKDGGNKTRIIPLVSHLS